MLSNNGKSGGLSQKAHLTLKNLNKDNTTDSYSLLGDMDDDLPTSPQLSQNNMFRENSQKYKETPRKPAGKPALVSTQYPPPKWKPPPPVTPMIPAKSLNPQEAKNLGSTSSISGPAMDLTPSGTNDELGTVPITSVTGAASTLTLDDQPPSRSEPAHGMTQLTSDVNVNNDMPQKKNSPPGEVKGITKESTHPEQSVSRSATILKESEPSNGVHFGRITTTTDDSLSGEYNHGADNLKARPSINSVSVLEQDQVNFSPRYDANKDLKTSSPDTKKRKMVTFGVSETNEQVSKSKVKTRRATTFATTFATMTDIGSDDDDLGDASDLIEKESDDEDDEDDEDGEDGENNENTTPESKLLGQHDNDQPQRKVPFHIEEKQEKWDVFESPPRPEDNEAIEFLYDATRKMFRIVTMVVCFVVVCGGALIHKATLLFAAAQLDSSRNYTCASYNASARSGSDYYRCLPVGVSTPAIPACFRGENLLDTPLWPIRKTPCGDIQVRWVWCLVLILATPEVFVFIRSVWNISFKKRLRPSMDAFFVVFFTETLSVLGTCCFVFTVLPALHSSIHGLALMAAVGFIPAVLNALNRPEDEQARGVQVILDILATVCQLSGLIFWPLLISLKWMNNYSPTLIWAIPVSLFLMSISWWMNYVDGASRLKGLGKSLVTLKRRVRKSRTKIYLVVSVWKIMMIVVGMLLFANFSLGVNFGDLFKFDRSNDPVCRDKITAADLPGLRLDWVFVWIINMGVAITSYFCARAAAKVWLQFQGYAMPLVLVTPLCAVLLMSQCNSWVLDSCALSTMVPEYLAFQCRPYPELVKLFTEDHIWIMYFWWLSQMWVSKHIWFPKNDRLVKTSILFFTPLYGGVAHEQWLLYNRCPKDKNDVSGKAVISKDAGTQKDLGEIEEGFGDEQRQRLKEERQQDKVPQIYICATMWHESKSEMVTMLKSILRLDLDQCTRKKTQEILKTPDNDFYNFEAHIFFDDCMARESQFKYTVNDFVALLVSVVDDAASAIYQMNISVPPPVKVPTPYGGRLLWTMPGGNQIICHLKDKEKIRVKKRWSQVMYMYYFLGFKLFSQQFDLPTKRKQLQADNTFLLALDGDIDFEPTSLRLLVDIMKRDIKVGAACGRIHPTGSGPMVWYQKFEYALGHWMQKATEHVLGCVLCSPGCFSLFRGSALMDNNVMHRYTTTSEEARHLVQYDQGEDRWLCTLLLQQGYRVEYSAASDSFTAAPEEFNVFYNQRRRWTPSTMANILDLLSSWRNTVKVNENLSVFYMIYQAAIFGSSLLGTGTIFLMIVGALQVATGIKVWISFMLNAVLIGGFLVLCLTTVSAVQLIAANLLTLVYGLIQVIVLIALFVQMASEGLCSPTFIFFMYVAGIFILAAIIHPQEFTCIIHGFLYFVLVPSMYMLLMVYSLTNLNDVSWGTREVKQSKSEKEIAEAIEEERLLKEKEKEEKKNGKLALMLSLFHTKRSDTKKNSDGWTFQWGGCFKFVCCPRPVQEDKTHLNMILWKIHDQNDILKEQSSTIRYQTQTIKKLSSGMQQLASHNSELVQTLLDSDEDMETTATNPGENLRKMSRKMSTVRSILKPPVVIENEPDDEDATEYVKRIEKEQEKEQEKEELAEKRRKEREAKKIKKLLKKELHDPEWIKDTDRLKEGPIELLPKDEEKFFQGLIAKYLAPLVKDAAKERAVNNELKELKNKVSFGYVLLNATFIVVIFILQQKEILKVPWVCPGLTLEPIGLLFLVFFGLIMFLQTVGMVTHRMGTFLHIVAGTQLMGAVTDSQAMLKSIIVSIAKSAKIEDGDNISIISEAESEYGGSEEVVTNQRKSIHKLVKGFDKGNGKSKRRPTMVLADTIDGFLNQGSDHMTDEQLNRMCKRIGVKPNRRKSLSALKYLVENRDTVPYRSSTLDSPLGDADSIRGYDNVGYSRFNKKNNNGIAPELVNYFDTQDKKMAVTQEQEVSKEATSQQMADSIPLGQNMVNRFSMSPLPDYSLVEEVTPSDEYCGGGEATN